MTRNDFTRSRKVPLGMLPSALVHWAQDTVAGEIHDFWGWDALAPNSSAFALQWKKFSDFAMPTLLHTLVCKFVGVAYVGRWHLVAADDTGMRVPETGDERMRVRSNQSGASHDELPERILRVKGKIRINRRWRRGLVLFRWPAPAFVHA